MCPHIYFVLGTMLAARDGEMTQTQDADAAAAAAAAAATWRRK